MSTLASSRLSRNVLLVVSRAAVRSAGATRPQPFLLRARGPVAASWRSHSRHFGIISRARAGIMPESEDPKPPPTEEVKSIPENPTPIEDDEYHLHADAYLETLREKAELMQEDRADVEVDYSAGVMNITIGDDTWVVNKQPPNRQIWLSSPRSGPKRFDWVLLDEAMDQKEGGGSGAWVYLRDGSTLSDVLRKELDIEVDVLAADIDTTTPSQDRTE